MTEVFTTISSPVGQLRVTASEEALTGIEFLDEKSAFEKTESRLLTEAERQLGAYFERKLTVYDLPLSPQGTPFQLRVWAALGEIPYGSSWSYKQLALFLGDIKCIRAAGTANGRNPLPIVTPCHRVIGSDNSLVGYGGKLWRKEWFLKHERHPLYLFQQGVLFD